MSLYYETAALLENPQKLGGSFKARIFKTPGLKSKPGQIYALVAEASKWSRVLKGVVEGCGVLGEERKVSLWFSSYSRSIFMFMDMLDWVGLVRANHCAHHVACLALALESHCSTTGCVYE